MTSTAATFAINPQNYGLPRFEELKALRIWDSHYHGFYTGGDPIQQHKDMLYYVRRMAIERIISVDIGGTLQDPLDAKPHDPIQWEILEKGKNFISGIIPIDPGFPEESCVKMEKWIKHGPCIGIKYVGGNKRGITCDHPNNDIIIRFANELGAAIYIHTWMKVGGNPKIPGGGNLAVESTPLHVAILARRFPDIPMICGHAGGEWELAARAVRPFGNVFFEFSGADPHSGSVDYAVNLLGADRIVWGGHGPSRSYATEISKVLDADLSDEDRIKIFGKNYRRLTQGIFRQKGMEITL